MYCRDNLRSGVQGRMREDYGDTVLYRLNLSYKRTPPKETGLVVARMSTFADTRSNMFSTLLSQPLLYPLRTMATRSPPKASNPTFDTTFIITLPDNQCLSKPTASSKTISSNQISFNPSLNANPPHKAATLNKGKPYRQSSNDTCLPAYTRQKLLHRIHN
ncbi:hypothetical protein MMC28_007293 [Mycoblastus sanguinarius]|nr:hypothetical protein [Mycoblastus sanguinarius]